MTSIDAAQNSQEELRVPLTSLGTLDRSTRYLGIGAVSLLAFFYLLFPAFPTVLGKSLAGWTWYACNNANGFLHGRFIPIAFVILCWVGFQRGKNELIKPNYLGLFLVAVGMLFYLVSVRTIQPRVAIIGAPFIVLGITSYLFGFRISRHFVFPAFFLWFAMPVPGLEMLLTGKLQVFITEACYHVGMFLGMDLTKQGATIMVSGSGLEIEGGCSGIRSLMALTMIAAVYANYTQKPMWKKAVLFASSFPLAVIGNFGRVFTIVLLTHLGFEDFARKTYHDWAGLLFFFPIALSGLYLVDYLLNLKTRRKKKVVRSVRTKSVQGGEEVSE